MSTGYLQLVINGFPEMHSFLLKSCRDLPATNPFSQQEETNCSKYLVIFKSFFFKRAKNFLYNYRIKKTV
jgi:hypothetical protein